MAGDFDAKARAIARATVDEFQNRGLGLTVEEAASVASAINSDAARGYCTSCGYEIQDLTQPRCAKCGNTQAQETPVFICSRCNRPVDKGMVACPSCHNTKAVRANPNMRPLRPGAESFTCANCLEPVALSQPSCGSCGSERAYRTISTTG